MKANGGVNKAKRTKNNDKNLEYDEYGSDDIQNESGEFQNGYDDEDDQ